MPLRFKATAAAVHLHTVNVDQNWSGQYDLPRGAAREVLVKKTVYNLHEAKTQLSKLVDRFAEGEEIAIAKHGRPMARMLPVNTVTLPRKPGGWEESLIVQPDFDDPLPPELMRALGAAEASSPMEQHWMELSRLLLGTDVLLWWRTNDPRLGTEAHEAIAYASQVFVSATTVWEIAIKLALGRLRLDGSVVEGIADSGFLLLAIDGPHAEAAGWLPPSCP